MRKVSEVQPVIKVQPVTEQKQIQRTEAREPLDEPKVSAAFDRYVQEHQPDTSVAIALRTHRPEVEGENICLAVDNQLQLDKAEALKQHLQGALMKTLNNGYISLSFKLFDHKTSTEEKKYFTASEIFEHFLELNPVVGDLKNIFGLELE